MNWILILLFLGLGTTIYIAGFLAGVARGNSHIVQQVLNKHKEAKAWLASAIISDHNQRTINLSTQIHRSDWKIQTSEEFIIYLQDRLWECTNRWSQSYFQNQSNPEIVLEILWLTHLLNCAGRGELLWNTLPTSNQTDNKPAFESKEPGV